MAERVRRKKLPSQDTLIGLLSYDRETGVLTFKERTPEFASENGWTLKYLTAWNAKYAGKTAGTVTPRGYLVVTILGSNYFAHRLIWKIVFGVDADHIDHIDGDKGDNRLENLRDVDAVENQHNRKLNSNNSTGHIGVHWCRTNKKFVARIKLGGRSKMLGRFHSLDDAIRVRKAAERELNFSKNHGHI